MIGHALIGAALLSLVLAWLTRRRVRTGTWRLWTGGTFPRCRTCKVWPGPDAPCPKNGEPQEPGDGCIKHEARTP